VQAAASAQDLNRTHIAARRPPQVRYQFTGKTIATPFVSSIRNACSRGRYTTNLARASVLAARFPARDARTKLECNSLCTHRGIMRDLGI